MPNWPQIVDQYKDLVRYWNHRPAGFALACRGITAQLVQQYVATAVQQSLSVPHTARLEKIIKMMHENVGRVHSVHELAHLAELSDSRFRLLFHQLTGFSVTRYQNRLRIHAARDLLLSGHYSVTQVAMELGFRDVYYFSRLFKKIAGFNPSECLSR
ncbi:MAG: helix-turn-helix transcriptional regulator [Phycisphaerales bacterium]|nr:helix-turn-helix transcriptional regulator [Phycisphaerales bacterium]